MKHSLIYHGTQSSTSSDLSPMSEQSRYLGVAVQVKVKRTTSTCTGVRCDHCSTPLHLPSHGRNSTAAACSTSKVPDQSHTGSDLGHPITRSPCKLCRAFGSRVKESNRSGS
ncbi:Down syndrome cell adhesion molecule-like protein Dscam2 [Anopheles arabiensis]|uniref:Down syndrome cell adhesion molecule-like protein Dscam2 n=1 Tax=Anopheles arabiensis TaxID=7173 RepID=UPI001AADF102|nr:Down syndrome cell adhesion molecule-like protein Dscam2 [Anopheles arabiensis]